MWPKLTNIESNIHNKITEYSNNKNVSKLNSWIRVISGAEYGNYKGLILQSNTDFKLLNAAGQASIYGNYQESGAIGKDWDGNIIKTTDTRFLRPSPVVTSFNVKEGKDQISREATLQLTAHSLEQMEALQIYLMEPGYSLYIEWGWNTPDSYTQLTKIESHNLAKTAADRNLNWENLSKIRNQSNGTYDSFLGFVVGGSVSNSGENFNIEVTLRGTPSLPTYLQSQKNLNKIKGDVVENSNKSVKLYGQTQLENNENSIFRKFGNMFNELPSYRQTEFVKSLETKVKDNQFINFDLKVSKEIVSALGANWFVSFFGGDDNDIDVRDVGEIAKDKLFSNNRYIRMDLAVQILNAIGNEDYYDIGGKQVKFIIDINDSVIGGFPYMFSTNDEKMIIPTKVPDFFNYFLQKGTVKQESDGILIVDGEEKYPIIPDFTLNNFLIEDVSNLNDIGLNAENNYCGYLKYLFVNFDIFKSKLEAKNKNIREIFLDILNEISSAANSFWNFQIVEGEFKSSSSTQNTQPSRAGVITNTGQKGDIIITVIDENWIGRLPFSQSEITEFNHIGFHTPFLESSLDMSIPSDMANMIINKRLSSTSNPDTPFLSISETSFFNSKKDLFMNDRNNIELPNESNDSNNNLENSNLSESEIELEKIEDELEILNRSTGAGGRGENQSRITQLSEKAEQLKTEIKNQRFSEVTAFLDKLDVVPRSNINLNVVRKKLKTLIENSYINSLKTLFSIYCFNDTEYFDKLKNEQYIKLYKKIDQVNPSLSHPLPIKYSFKIFGNSGIRRGDVFKIKGIPSKYSERGIFQVTEIEHTLDGNLWYTNITGQYRQIQ